MNKKLVAKRNYVLRKVLNSENNLEIIKDFIQAILKIQIKKIELNRYLEEKAKNLPSEDNFGVVDVRVKTKENEELNIGIQFLDGKYIRTKLLLYYTLIHNNQLEYNTKREIVKTITINILDFNYYPNFCYHKVINLSNKKEFDEEIVELHILELPKFQSIYLNSLNKEEQWMTYLKGDNEEEVLRVKRLNYKIAKLDKLVEEFWNKEVIE